MQPYLHSMRRTLALLALAGLMACTPAKSNPEAPPTDTKAELDQFREFVREHPRVLEELQKDPSLIQSSEFADEHRAVREYLSKHPTIKDELKKYPKFFDGLTATTQGGKNKNGQTK
jgi:hypothetical protein